MPGVGAKFALVVPVLLAAVALAACGGGGSGDTVDQPTVTSGASEEASEEQPFSAAEEHGRELFVATCGACHTLDAAGTQGQIGPDLGDVPLDEAEVLAAIENGGRGSGNMPSGLLSGRDAKDVAAFVAASGP